MEITALGYIGIHTRNVDVWTDLASNLLGMQAVERCAAMSSFRMDDRKQRLILEPAPNDGLGVTGWEVANDLALQNLAARLDLAGVKVARGDRALAAMRKVADLIVFHDPEGNRLEAFHGAEVAGDPFRPGRPVSGFKTGPLGMGHVVINVMRMDDMLAFYMNILGFKITDYTEVPYKVYFLHINGRHHSFAMAENGYNSLNHFMIETLSLDDVGQGYDIAQIDEGRVAFSLGRHSNDHMTSFYATTPSGFFVEYGWGARVIDPATWKPHQTFDGPSFWGHERLHLPEGQDVRLRLRKARLDAAARGVRAPLMGDYPSYDAAIHLE